ncbi:MAG: hypothetical protein IJ408_04210 [Clostridia bacterium]|nr:hypothetical protein [Clostridia bacterium]
MVRRKLFLSFLKEYQWLVHKNRNGYELDSRRLFNYDIKKTLVPVSYEYVFLKNGKRSYKEFDYKSKDPDAKAVYANSDILLVKKPISLGKITVFKSADEKKQNALKKRASLNTTALVLLGIALIMTVFMKILSPFAIVFLIADVFLILLAGYNYFLSYQIGKYIKKDS